MNKLVVWFDEVDKSDGGIVGGKGANLGEMTKAKIPVPPGFIVTSHAYFLFLEASGLKKKIVELLESVNIKNDPVGVQRISAQIKKMIVRADIPKTIVNEINKHYENLKKHQGIRGVLEKVPAVAVRSSATAEDLPQASFAGQQATFLNVKGDANLINAVRECWASLFEARAIFYRVENKFDHFKVGIAVPVQRMVQSDVSGVMFTIDPVTNNRDRIVVEAVWGLGEMIVQGAATPDHYELAKTDFKILQANISAQKRMLRRKSGSGIEEVEISKSWQARRKLNDAQVTEIARLGKTLEDHYSHPQDIEFAVENDKVYIVQTRPITTLNKKEDINTEALEKIERTMELLVEGEPASPGIRTGPVKILSSAKEIGKILPGDVLVAPQTNPDFVPAMKKAVAIVTDKGGRTSHAAIVSRELGIPAIVGTGNATSKLKNNQIITVDGAQGKVYKGALKYDEIKSEIRNPKSEIRQFKTATKVYVNLAEPERAKQVAAMNVDGIGLLRAEFMLAQMGVHPKKVIHDGKQREYVNQLADNLRVFAESFYPKPVVYRATDFKTNEYRNLKGGDQYEPEEPNPMLGFRGAYRYIVQPEVFRLELEAIKKVRNEFGLKNFWMMIPFVRTVMELMEVKSIMHAAGLQRSPTFHLWMMCEIPSNVILLEKFIEAGIDGVSIGSNDLTMLVMGTDRDNDTVASEFNERNPAVTWALEHAVKTCKKYDVTCSLCGQAASTYPDLVKDLVSWGITSVSVSPDAIDKTREFVYEAEKALVSK